jgi:hypothetical protein
MRPTSTDPNKVRAGRLEPGDALNFDHYLLGTNERVTNNRRGDESKALLLLSSEGAKRWTVVSYYLS